MYGALKDDLDGIRHPKMLKMLELWGHLLIQEAELSVKKRWGADNNAAGAEASKPFDDSNKI